MAKKQITLRNDLAELARMTAFIEELAEEHGIGPKDVFAITLSLDELITNIINYGFEDDAPHEILLSAEIQGDSVVIGLEDDARPFDPTVAPEPDIHIPVEERNEGGLGIHFVRKMMADFDYERSEGKNRLRLRRVITR